jgi:SAM-dependent methyltransferase
MPEGYIPQGFLPRTREAIHKRGARPVIGDLARWGAGAVAGLPWSVAGRHGQFEFQGRRYGYLYHRYNLTWLSERAVEVPVAQAIVDRHAPGTVLEVGHVLGHYRAQSHTIVDKYEEAAGVLNRDVLELGSMGPFDLIVAVSTLEHVGWDEEPRDPAKAVEAVGALRGLLAPGGRLVVTVPVGYNPAFDAAFRDGAIEVSGLAALRRVPGSTRWREVDPGDVWSTPYDFLVYSARGVLFAFIDADADAEAGARTD